MARASVDAELIVTELSAADGTGPVIEDRLCLLLGKTLTEHDAAQDARRASGEEEILDSYSPDQLLDAVTDKALLKVSELVGGDDADAATRALRLSAAIARVTPYPSAEIPTRAMAQLTKPTSTDPNISTDCTPAGPALWCRDGYGTRFAIIAPFESAGRVDCWYLWDIDVCGSDAYTVASGFHPSPDHALTAWRKTVGPTATEASRLEPVTDPQLAASLLPGLPDFLHPGGEDEAQYAEYHRSRRLAQELRSSDHLDGSLESAGDASPDDAVEKSAWIAEFTAWRSKHRPGNSAVPDGFPPIEDNEPLTDAVVFEELADIWFTGNFPEFAYSCSPHRLELWASAVREIFTGDFAAVVLQLAPDVAAWLTCRSDLSPTLANHAAAFADLVGTTAADGGHRTDEFSFLAPVEE